MQINVKRFGNHEFQLPHKAHAQDAGLDLITTLPKTLKPGERFMFPCGFGFSIPEGFYGQIQPRSGWAIKHGLDTMAGVIDSGYNNEVNVILINHGEYSLPIEAGERIAQLVILPIPTINLIEVEAFASSNRGLAGFGSTGV